MHFWVWFVFMCTFVLFFLARFWMEKTSMKFYFLILYIKKSRWTSICLCVWPWLPCRFIGLLLPPQLLSCYYQLLHFEEIFPSICWIKFTSLAILRFCIVDSFLFSFHPLLNSVIYLLKSWFESSNKKAFKTNLYTCKLCPNYMLCFCSQVLPTSTLQLKKKLVMKVP